MTNPGHSHIADVVPLGELLAQLAEETAELAQASLYLRRSIEGKNPINVATEEAEAKLLEEIADVYVCVDMVCASLTRAGNANIIKEIFEAKQYKLSRWERRLRERGDNCADACPILGDADRPPAEQEPPRM